MIKLALAGVVIIIILIAFIIIIRNKPDLWFWIFLNLYFDPGGYVEGFLGGNLFGILKVSDFFIVGLFICIISVKINWKEIFEDRFLSRFLFFLFIFSLYYYIVYGGIQPYLHNDFNYLTFLIKNRMFFYGIIILISVYAFSLRSLYYFYATTLSVGAICLSFYLLTLLSGIKLVPVEEMGRNLGNDAMIRVWMSSYGLFYMLFPISLTTYLLSKKINLSLKLKRLLFYSGIVLIITQILTLTRRVQIDIIGTIIIITLLISYILRIGKLSSMIKIIIPSLIILLILSFAFPNYVGYMAKIGEDTFLLITTGKDSKGQSDQRVSGNQDYKIVEEYIASNLLFGTGYTYLSWEEKGYASSPRGPKFSSAADAAGELPIYYLFFGFGIAGAVLVLPLYFVMIELFLRLIKLLRLIFYIYTLDSLTLIISIYILLSIMVKFTYKLYNLSLDFTGENLSGTAVLMGIGFALYHKIYSENYGK